MIYPHASLFKKRGDISLLGYFFGKFLIPKTNIKIPFINMIMIRILEMTKYNIFVFLFYLLVIDSLLSIIFYGFFVTSRIAILRSQQKKNIFLRKKGVSSRILLLQHNYLYFLFLAASDFFLRLTLGFS